MMRPFMILDLPTELIRQICLDGELNRHDLMALRLTCTFTEALVNQAFDRMCFCGISVLMTRRSLQTLIDISKHPRIGPQIQVVTLTPLRAFEEALPILVPPNSSIHRENGSEILRASTKSVCHYLTRCHEETELEQSGGAGELLREAFTLLGEYGRPLCLMVSDDEQTHIGGRGCLSSTTEEHDEDMNVWKMHWAETMRVLIMAVTKSHCHVARLSLRSYTNADHMHNASLWSDDLDGDINRLCQSLTAFDVDFDCLDANAVLKSVKQVLSQAKDLNILTAEQIGPPLSYDLAEVSGCVASASLEAINISYAWCTELDLVSFLSKHKSTIEHLSLRSFQVVGSWRSLVSWIKSNLRALHTFGMEDVHDTQSDNNEDPIPSCNFDEIEDM